MNARLAAPTFRSLILLVLPLLLAPLAGGAPIDAAWDGGAGTSNYSDPDNWDIDAVPLNDGNTYNVTLAPGGTVFFDVDTPGTVTDLTLGAGTTLEVKPGHSLTVLDDAAVSGVLKVNNSTFSAAAPGAAFGGNTARLFASGGGSITLAGTSYSSTGIYVLHNSTTQVVFDVAGAGSTLDLSSLQSLNAGFDDTRTDRRTVQQINATNSGTIDFSSLEVVTGPVRSDDRLEFHIDNGGSMDLSALQTINRAGSGQVHFYVETAAFTLPSLLNATGAKFALDNLGPGTLLNLPQLTTFSAGTIEIPADGLLEAPVLTTLSGSLNVGAGGDANLPLLDTFSDGTLTLAPNAVLHAPNLTSVLNASYTASPGRTLDAPAPSQIDNSRLGAVAGAHLAVAATSYATTTEFVLHNSTVQEMLHASDANSVLDLSTIATLNARFDDTRTDRFTYQQINASAGGRIDLSGVSSISGPVRSDDRLEINLSGGGVVDLSSLAETTGGNVRFDIAGVPGGAYALPSLVTARDTSFATAAGTTLNLPALETYAGGTTTLGDGGSLEAAALQSYAGSLTLGDSADANLPALTRFSDGTLSLGQNAAVNAPALAALVNANLTLEPGRTLNTAPLTNIDDSHLAVAGGAQLAVAAAGYSSLNEFVLHNSTVQTLLSAAGAGSLLDLASVTVFNARFDDTRTDRFTYQQVNASAGGRIDLSGVSRISGPVRSDDRLEINLSGGGVVDLSSLAETTGGNVRFSIAETPGGTYALPALVTARDVSLNVGEGIAVNLPALETYTGSVTLDENAEANMPSLASFSGGSVTIGQNGAFRAPALANFTNASLTLGPNQVFHAPAVTDIDNSRLAVTGGAQLAPAAGTYDATGLVTVHNNSNWTLFSASGAGSRLDLSALASIHDAVEDFRTDRWTRHWVTAEAGGKIDLSGVSSITGPVRADDSLTFTAESGGEIDLSGLQSVSAGGSVAFNIGGQSRMRFGDLTVSAGMKVSLTDVSSELEVAGSLLLDSTSSLTATGGSVVRVGGDATFTYTDESRLAAAAAVLAMDGAGFQFLEIGGQDDGMPDPNETVAGNFALGQLVVGSAGRPTVVQLLEATDNGNRGGAGEPEALYLNGLGGPDGLILAGGSTLILDNLHVYTTENNRWVLLNDLFGPGEVRIPYSDGFLELPEPATLVFVLAGVPLLLRRRR